MEQYFFNGKILPDRAQLSLQFSLSFKNSLSENSGKIKVNIVLNQLAAWVDTEETWDIFDLRNVVNGVVLDQLAIVGYIKGYAYDIEITRVINQNLGIDFVFGIDILCLRERGKFIDFDKEFFNIRNKTIGKTAYSCVDALKI